MDTATASPDIAKAKSPLVSLSIAAPDEQIVAEAMTAVAYAEKFVIETTSDSVKAQEARARINTKIKSLEDARLLLTKPIDTAKKTIMDFFNAPKAKMERAKAIFDQKILAFDDKQKAIAAEAQRKADAAAAAERKRLADIAEAARVKAEAEAKAKREAAEAAAAAGRAAEAAKLQAQAERIEEKGAAKAEQFETRAATVVAPTIQTGTAKAAGAQFRDNWQFKITDPAKVKAAFLSPDEVKIGKVVKALGKDAEAAVGGIEVVNNRVLATKRSA